MQRPEHVRNCNDADQFPVFHDRQTTQPIRIEQVHRFRQGSVGAGAEGIPGHHFSQRRIFENAVVFILEKGGQQRRTP